MAIDCRPLFRAGTCFCAIPLFFLICAWPVCAWDKGGRSGGQHGWSPSQAVQGARNRISESVRGSAEHAAQSVREGVRQGKERIDALSNQAGQAVAESSAHAQESIGLRYQEIRDSTSHALVAEFRCRLNAARRAASPPPQGSAGDLSQSMLDPEARERVLAAAALIAASVGIASLKAIPIFDSEIGRLVTLDVLVRALVGALSPGEVGDFGKDPLAAAFLLMFDRDYLLQARIVPSPAGDEYLSIAELIGMGVEDKHLSLATDAYYRSLFAWKAKGDPVMAAQQAESFALELRLINAPAWDRGRRIAEGGAASHMKAGQEPALALLQDLIAAAVRRDVASARALHDLIAGQAKPARGDVIAARVFSARGMEDFGKGQFGTAEEAFRQAAARDPRDENVLVNLGAVLLRSGRPADAQGILERALVIEPGNAQAWLGLGRVHAMLGAQTRQPGLLARALQFLAGSFGIDWIKLPGWARSEAVSPEAAAQRQKASAAFFAALLLSRRPERTLAELAALSGDGNPDAVKDAARTALIDSGKALESAWGPALARAPNTDRSEQAPPEEKTLFSLRIGL